MVLAAERTDCHVLVAGGLFQENLSTCEIQGYGNKTRSSDLRQGSSFPLLSVPKEDFTRPTDRENEPTLAIS